MTSPDDLLRGVRPQQPPMPDHVRRSIDARLSEAAAREASLVEREAHQQGPGRFERQDDVVVALLDNDRSVTERRRNVPIVAAAILLAAGVVGAIAFDAARDTPLPVATSVAGIEAEPGIGSGSVDAASGTPLDARTDDAAVEETPTPLPGFDPRIEAILAGLPTAQLDPEHLGSALDGVSLPSADIASERRQLTRGVISAVACAWVKHWHDAVGRGDTAEAGRAVAVFADLDRWGALDGPGLRGVGGLVVDVGDALVSAGASPADPDDVAAPLRRRVCDA